MLRAALPPNFQPLTRSPMASGSWGLRPRRHGGITGPCPPNDCLCPPKRSVPLSEVFAPKKLMDSGLPECKSRPETCKIVLIASEFVENLTSFGIKTRTCGNFLTEDIFFWSSLFSFHGSITLRILDGIAWNFAQAKWWKTVRCGGLISSCCPRNPHGKAGNEERRRAKKKKKQF